MKLSDRHQPAHRLFEQSVDLPELERVGARLSLDPAAARVLASILRVLLRLLSFGLLGRE